MLIRKLKSSLTLKIFIFTSLLLCTVSALTYGLIALWMPITYTSQLDDEIEQKALRLVTQLKQTTLAESGPLLDQFQMSTGTSVSIINENNETVMVPGRLDSSLAIDYIVYTDTEINSEEVTEEEAIQVKMEEISTSIAVTRESPENEWGRMLNQVKDRIDRLFQQSEGRAALSRSQGYAFSFTGDDTSFNLIIVSDVRGVNQAIAAIGLIFPWLALAVFIAALLSSLWYACFITRPIVRLSRISKQLAQLDFQWQCNESRSDEIGTLARNFNILSKKLSLTLDELHKANTALQEDIFQEREAKQQRMEFFAAVSHELKTPITIIKGQLEGMLYQVGSYQDREKYLARSLHVTNQLESMVQEILTISRMETKEFTIKLEAIDMAALVQEQIENYKDLIKKKQQTCHLQMPPALMVRGSCMLLQKLISNLLSNAVHYSPAGAIIEINLYEETDYFYFHVMNTGVQLPEETLSQLFQPFSRVEQSRSRQTGGSGLGLYLVRMILEQHGAQAADYGIRNVEHGVLVYFRLPIEGCVKST